jgi:hypothetical protein
LPYSSLYDPSREICYTHSDNRLIIEQSGSGADETAACSAKAKGSITSWRCRVLAASHPDETIMRYGVVATPTSQTP